MISAVENDSHLSMQPARPRTGLWCKMIPLVDNSVDYGTMEFVA